ncbi:primosomal protein N' [Marvinbryantia formatexigens DSM 14469]|uniref:Replication restart protein PriA n=1 Tax=Marvinbryantia formatexigens DSM 14469 TaxID=478749 RepID=C6LGY2_9FIRM|nr:primosomal protein N' [Marvinbryantia formatexigens]EET60041.1 primosomal protein N' [Marvinbryantia formatexigens DSM 14469]UWO23840.1 primosomal protein N' [Marvinbryantia formatexigens DSM 14469]SDG49937.1 replication restart DNA helicase PriA [Marvinbryantia formatexigens]
MTESLFADIIVDISHERLDRTFQYRIPEALRTEVRQGSVVRIPFGKGGRITKGYVMKLTGTPEIEPSRIKDICEVVSGDAGTSGEDRLVALAAWMRERYGSTMVQALRTVIPVKQKIKPRQKKSLRLLLDEEQTQEKIAFYRQKNQRARLRLLEALEVEQELPYELATGRLNISAATVKAMEEQGVLACETVAVYRNPVHQSGASNIRIPLNEEQSRIVEDIRRNWDNPQQTVSLIHGITGSGKTEIYMELIDTVIARGQQAIVLIPEIALTYQTVMRFYRRFGERISIIHSRLSAGERYDQFQRARAGDIDVMIGPRSALFTPFPDLGIIIIDEEHEPTYQSEQTPRYHARETAIKRAELEHAKVILGSATPSLEAYSRALDGEYALYTLKKRAKNSSLPETVVADMRRELAEGNRSILGRTLKKELEQCLARGQQAMLFLNRRGYSGFLSCRACGHVLMCPHCDVSLSLHNNGRMVCHYCGYTERRPARCPKCGSEFLSGFGIGTQQAQEMVAREFPQARILRMDMDTTREKDGHEKILSAFANREADILIGTQMIVKGHDFPDVTLVGILAADLSLFADDYRASERTFQLITQAAGRAGRGKELGKVVIQTYDPEHYCIRTAAAQDYESFYEEEISYRMVAGYPPARKMLSIHGTCRDEQHLGVAMEYLRRLAERIYKNSEGNIIGPAPESIAKIQEVYRRVLYIKAGTMEELTAIKDRLEQYIEANDGYRSVGIQFDMNE